MATSQQTKKILILDDEPDVVAYLEMLLTDNGYETISAVDGKDGLEKTRTDKPDLVTLDISMPGTSGVRFYRELKADPELAKIPVIIVTAVTGFDGDPYAYLKFVNRKSKLPEPEGFFPKPIDKEKFLATVRDLLT